MFGQSLWLIYLPTSWSCRATHGNEGISKPLAESERNAQWEGALPVGFRVQSYGQPQ